MYGFKNISTFLISLLIIQTSFAQDCSYDVIKNRLLENENLNKDRSIKCSESAIEFARIYDFYRGYGDLFEVMPPNIKAKIKPYRELCFSSFRDAASDASFRNKLDATIEKIRILFLTNNDGIKKPVCNGISIEGGWVFPKHCFSNRNAIKWHIASINIEKQKLILRDLPINNLYARKGYKSKGNKPGYDYVIVGEGHRESIRFSDHESPSCSRETYISGYNKLIWNLSGGKNSKDFINELSLSQPYTHCSLGPDYHNNVSEHFCESTGGSSGAPIFQITERGEHKVVGMHIGGIWKNIRNAKNLYIPIDEIKKQKLERFSL